MKIFAAQNISIKVGNRYLCTGLSFRLKQGDKLAVLGPNGAGKTSLINVCAGLLRPHTGTVSLDQIAPHPEDQRLSVGSQFSDYPSFYLVKELLRIFELGSGRQPLPALAELHRYLSPCLNSYHHNLSGGERKLVSNYIAIQLDSNLLLFDEPTSSLDVIATTIVNTLLKSDPRTLIFSSHDLREAMKITRQILFLTGQQAYHFDLRHADEFALYARASAANLPVEGPYQYCQIDDMAYLLAAVSAPKPPRSWRLQGKFSAILVLYQIFNLIRSAEEQHR